jgi:hypothetical protein
MKNYIIGGLGSVTLLVLAILFGHLIDLPRHHVIVSMFCAMPFMIMFVIEQEKEDGKNEK